MVDASQMSRRIKLRQLNVFIAVVEYGSMVKAAEHLAISQPVISKMIASLEQTLGLPLLERSRLGVEPTLYGKALLKRSIALCNDLRSSVTELQSLADPAMGELRIGSTEPVMAGLLPDPPTPHDPDSIAESSSTIRVGAGRAVVVSLFRSQAGLTYRIGPGKTSLSRFESLRGSQP